MKKKALLEITSKIGEKNVYLVFFLSWVGEHAGFCEEQPTCATGGKPTVVGMLKKKHSYKNIVMIGDGATDLEAFPPAVSPLFKPFYTCNVCINTSILILKSDHRFM